MKIKKWQVERVKKWVEGEKSLCPYAGTKAHRDCSENDFTPPACWGWFSKKQRALMEETRLLRLGMGFGCPCDVTRTGRRLVVRRVRRVLREMGEL